MSSFMDKLGFQSYQDFEDHYNKVWEDFKKDGDDVLETNLISPDEKPLREIFNKKFSDEEFSRKLLNYWKEHYQIKIDKPSDFVKVFKGTEGITKIYCDSENRIYITNKFFEKIRKHIQKDGTAYIICETSTPAIIVCRDKYEIFVKFLNEHLIIKD